MKSGSLPRAALVVLVLVLSLLPAPGSAQTGQANAPPPPIDQPLVTEGLFAVDLAAALDISASDDAVEAESALGDVGILPRNGWIADYPVTPDIVAELRGSVAAAVDAGQLSLGRDDALKRFDDALAGAGLAVRAYASGEATLDRPVSCENYPNPGMIGSYYSSEGPPIVTYYCPPPDYYYLYSWVPYPFWWADFWFPGYFILRDFDRHVPYRGRFVEFSNHFNDVRRHRMFRIDPVDRFHGRTYAGIGVRPSRRFIPTGQSHGSRTIFNAPRGRSYSRSFGGNASFTRRGPAASPALRSGGVSVRSGSSGVRSGGGGTRGIRGGGGMRGGGGGMHGGERRR